MLLGQLKNPRANFEWSVSLKWPKYKTAKPLLYSVRTRNRKLLTVMKAGKEISFEAVLKKQRRS